MEFISIKAILTRENAEIMYDINTDPHACVAMWLVSKGNP